jgi:prolyl-tRNA synthetase
MVTGANEDGWHLSGVDLERDIGVSEWADLREVGNGETCSVCGGDLERWRGVEVGHIFKLGTKYTKAFDAFVQDEEGISHPIIMGSYGIGVGRSVACVVEAHHDDKGIVWPAEVAPYAAHLVEIGADRDPQVREVAERLHALALDAGREILYDDRDERPGVKFTDAELLGMPWILTVSPRSLAAGGIEVTERATGERTTRTIEEAEALLSGG